MRFTNDMSAYLDVHETSAVWFNVIGSTEKTQL
jgi:hypothetical protein